MEENFDLVISIVNRGYSDAVVEASHEAGASGGTIIYGRGTNSLDKDTFLGVSIQPEKEVIMTLAPSEIKNKIMENICEKANLDSVGMGICFSLPVNKVRGIKKEKLEGNEEKIENKTNE